MAAAAKYARAERELQSARMCGTGSSALYEQACDKVPANKEKDYTTSEQNASMMAMDNASKNASKVIGKLTLTFNRIGQAVSTKELIEIISSAAALD
ncbi:ATP synthase subunit gamma, mitochondrial [Myotis brandtii]|uniref:ATP synthase subunit gamma, mitochondrial n=1 Tax=Myotis brandtii TaxID=109478 RepID=S7NB42_MYOBR|nr:ATP synthase subunit gamma, mitochondrial [Myotis brandtii]